MTTTTSELYSVNGTNLNQLCWNFKTFDGRLNYTPRRGTNSEIAFGPDKFRGKWLGPRTEQWALWIRGLDPADDSVDGRARFMSNLRILKALFAGNPMAALALQRIVADPAGNITQTAVGECVGFTVNPDLGATYANVVVDIVIPSGYWTGASGTQALSVATTSVTVGGDCIIPATSIVATGAFTIANATTGTGLAYSGGAGTIYPATLTGSSSGVVAATTPTGQRWLDLAAGSNSITVTGSGVTLNWVAGYQ